MCVWMVKWPPPPPQSQPMSSLALSLYAALQMAVSALLPVFSQSVDWPRKVGYINASMKNKVTIEQTNWWTILTLDTLRDWKETCRNNIYFAKLFWADLDWQTGARPMLQQFQLDSGGYSQCECLAHLFIIWTTSAAHRSWTMAACMDSSFLKDDQHEQNEKLDNTE